jgi:hypothetical protein
MESIPFTLKPNSDKINKKRVSKGASLCYDGFNTIYATKGNGTFEFWAYDITANTWATKPMVPSVKGLKGGTGLVYHNGLVYLLAGSQKIYNKNFYVYNPGANLWDSLTPAPIGINKAYKDGSCLAVLGDSIYALKGGAKYNEFYKYDIASNSWNSYPDNSIPLIHSMMNGKKTKVKTGGAMCSDGSKIYAIKGGGKQDFWSYQPLIGWTPLDTIPRLHKKSVPKAGASLTFYEDSVYLLKGNKLAEFWRYGPIESQKSKGKGQK